MTDAYSQIYSRPTSESDLGDPRSDSPPKVLLHPKTNANAKKLQLGNIVQNLNLLPRLEGR